MMKIDAKEEDGRLILSIEGRLAGAFVAELERCWKSARSRRGCDVALDLKSVTCIDSAGRQLLRSMHADGVRFWRASPPVQDILEQVMQDGCQ